MLYMGNFVGDVKQKVPEPSTENYRQLRNGEGRRNSFSEEKATNVSVLKSYMQVTWYLLSRVIL